MQGRIQCWNPTRGFGFVVTKDTTYYFHAKNFSGEPALGARVRFDIGPSLVPGKPPQAINVAPLFVIEDPATAQAAQALVDAAEGGQQ